MKIDMMAETHPGAVRTHNEDHVELWPARQAWAVLDGVGGSYSGQPAVRCIVRAFDEALRCELPLTEIMEYAHRELIEAIAQDVRMMGSGAVALLARVVAQTRLEWVHAGDCRLYRLRDGKLERLSREHTLCRDYLDLGVLATEDVDDFPYKNIVTSALGMAPSLKIDEGCSSLLPGDLYLACSDGLYDMVSDERITHVLVDTGLAFEELVDRLILEANMAGGKDNIAIMVMRVRSA